MAEEKARVKREERVIKQWTRLIQGLRIRQRLQEQYGTKSDRAVVHEDKTARKGKGKLEEQQQHAGQGAGIEDRDLQVENAGKDGLLEVEVEGVRIYTHS